MAFSGWFALRLSAWLALFTGCATALAFSIATPGLPATRATLAAATLLAGFLLWRHVSRTNRELARFIDSVRFGDLSAAFSGRRQGSGFDRLGSALSAAIAQLRAERGRQGDVLTFYEAMIEQVPVPILTVDPAGHVTLANSAARHLFAHLPAHDLPQFARVSSGLAQQLEQRGAPGRQLVLLNLPDGAQRAMVNSATLARPERATRIVTIEPVQAALNAAEIAAQSDLVRVLTHEIMNSLTPITSLAHSAAALLAEDDPAAAADARAAVATLARRADGVMGFVRSYRLVSRPPDIHRQRFAARPFADEIARLFTADWPPPRTRLAVSVTPADLTLNADPDLLAQVLINLLRNGAEAAAARGGDHDIALSLEIAAGHQRDRITVTDNGPGIPEAMLADLFLPFFTTKPQGTGIGLSLARQIVLAHNGTIDASNGAVGARFDIRI
ncbi:MAG: hypothetical protein A4S16_07125 [Proteobacteria bacterium SG_bin6]|nr:MAG: hypothetical protein A4S16_07125 [Proteobacteria bacterium SG_bin6]